MGFFYHHPPSKIVHFVLLVVTEKMIGKRTIKRRSQCNLLSRKRMILRKSRRKVGGEGKLSLKSTKTNSKNPKPVYKVSEKIICADSLLFANMSISLAVWEIVKLELHWEQHFLNIMLLLCAIFWHFIMLPGIHKFVVFLHSR